VSVGLGPEWEAIGPAPLAPSSPLGPEWEAIGPSPAAPSLSALPAEENQPYGGLTGLRARAGNFFDVVAKLKGAQKERDRASATIEELAQADEQTQTAFLLALREKVNERPPPGAAKYVAGKFRQGTLNFIRSLVQFPVPSTQATANYENFRNDVGAVLSQGWEAPDKRWWTTRQLGAAAEMTYPMAVSLAATAAVPGAGVGASLVKKGLLGTARVGAAGGPFLPSIQQQHFAEMVKEGIPVKTAKGVSWISAPAIASIEAVEPNWFRKTPAGEMAAKSVRQAITRFGAEFLKRFGKEWIAEEGGQAAVEYLGTEIARGISKQHAPHGVVEGVQTVFNQLTQSGAPIFLMMGPAIFTGGARAVREGKMGQLANYVLSHENGPALYAQMNPEGAALLERISQDHTPTRAEWRKAGLPEFPGIGIPERADFARRVRELFLEPEAAPAEAPATAPTAEAAAPVPAEVQPSLAPEAAPVAPAVPGGAIGPEAAQRPGEAVRPPAATPEPAPEVSEAVRRAEEAMKVANKLDDAAGRAKGTPAEAEARALHKAAYAEARRLGKEALQLEKEAREAAAAPETVFIKNAATEARREELGLSPRTPVQPHPWAAAKAEAAAASPQQIDTLLAKLREKPRPLFDRESAMVLRRQHELERAHADALARGDDPAATEVETRLADVFGVAEYTGEELGRGLAFRAAEIRLAEDFSTAGLFRRRIEAKGGKPLTPVEREQVQEQAKRIADLEGQLADHAAGREQEAIDREIEKAKEERELWEEELPAVGRKPRPSARRQVAQQAVTDAWANFSRVTSGKVFANPLDPELLGAAVAVGKAYIDLGVVRFSEFWNQVQPRLGTDAEKLQETFRAAWQSLRESGGVPAAKIDPNEQAGISRLAKTILREVVATGTVEREAATDAVHGELEAILPDWTRRDTQGAITGEGLRQELAKDPASVRYREIVGEVQQLMKLQEMEARRPPPLFGREQHAPSDAERHLRQQVNEAKRKGGFVVTDPVRQGKTALAQAKTTARHWLADREEEIRTGKRIVTGKTSIIPDRELLDLRQRQAQVRELWEATFPKPGKTDAQRLAAMESLYDRMIAEMKQDIAAGGVRAKLVSKILHDPELEAKKAAYAALKAQREELRANNPVYQASITARQDAAYMRSLTSRLAKLQTRRAQMAATGKIPAKKTVRERKLDQQGKDLLYEIDQEKGKIRVEEDKITRANRTRAQKAVGAVADISDLSMTIMTGFEMSVVLRQGFAYTLGFPEKALPALVKAARAVFSKRAEHAIHVDLTKRPNAADYRLGKLETTETEGPLAVREELLRSRIVDWLAARKHPLVRPISLPARVLLSSVRGFRTFANVMRADFFDYQKADIEAGRTWTPDDARVVGNASNLFSGRAPLRQAVGLSRVFFAPRWVWSRAQLLVGQPLWRGDYYTRKAIGKVYVRWALGMAAFYGLRHIIYSLTADDEEHEPAYELSRLSADFGKTRLGKTRVDVGGGFPQLITLGARLATGTTKTQKGKIVPISGPKVPYGGMTSEGAIGAFGRRKLAPLPSGVLDYLTEENAIGQPATIGSILYERFTPMTWNDIFAAEKELGVKQGTVAAVDAFFGAGLQTYQDRKTTTRRKRPQAPSRPIRGVR